MSNVKRVNVVGTLPFNADEFHADILKLYGQLNRPVFGLRLRWTGKNTAVPNEQVDPNTPYTGGITTICEFEIRGEEAVSWAWLAWMEDTIRLAKGSISIRRMVDIEA